MRWYLGKYRVIRRRRIAREIQTGQVSAVGEGIIGQIGDAGGNNHVGQSRGGKRSRPDAGHRQPVDGGWNDEPRVAWTRITREQDAPRIGGPRIRGP